MPLQFEMPSNFNDELTKSLKDIYIQAIQEAKRDFGYMKEYLTIKEACDFVSVSTNTFITNFISEGLPIYKIGNKQYVKKSELNNFISKHRI